MRATWCVPSPGRRSPVFCFCTRQTLRLLSHVVQIYALSRNFPCRECAAHFAELVRCGHLCLAPCCLRPARSDTCLSCVMALCPILRAHMPCAMQSRSAQRWLQKRVVGVAVQGPQLGERSSRQAHIQLRTCRCPLVAGALRRRVWAANRYLAVNCARRTSSADR